MAASAGAVLMLARRCDRSEGFVLALASLLVCAGLWNGRLLRDRGRPVYAMLDETEVDTFREGYRDVGDVSWLDKPPLVSPANRVYLYLIAEGR